MKRKIKKSWRDEAEGIWSGYGRRVSRKEALGALDEFKRTDGMDGYFFARRRGQDINRPDQFGPSSAANLNWDGFVEALSASRD